jgi:hypothetical protein
LRRRVAAILLLLTVGMQSLPNQICAAEQALTGHSCHDDDLAVADAHSVTGMNGFDGHASSQGQHDPGCACELPKSELNRHVPADAPVDLLPASALPLGADLPPASPTVVPAPEPQPDVVARTLTLPLLI